MPAASAWLRVNGWRRSSGMPRPCPAPAGPVGRHPQGRRRFGPSGDRAGVLRVGFSVMALTSETRPWGSWHVLDEGEGYKIKRIEVNPRSRLSYQTHQHRAELWIVVSGVATYVV